jgi:hypothetical protein
LNEQHVAGTSNSQLPRIPPKHLKDGCYARADAIEAHLTAAKAEITQLRGNLSLAEEGLANATQHILQLQRQLGLGVEPPNPADDAEFGTAEWRAANTLETSAVAVAGDSLPTTLANFEHRATHWLGEEQARANPNNALIALLCDAVRLARENERLARAPLKANEGQSCRCPAKPGEDCPLTNEQCLKRTELSENA